jgi:uncharacterized membrane protein
MYMEPYGGFPFGFLMILAGLIFFAGFVLLVIWAARAVAGPPASRTVAPTPPAPVETPLDILARRFASGEITAEDYQKARTLLTTPPPSPP